MPSKEEIIEKATSQYHLDAEFHANVENAVMVILSKYRVPTLYDQAIFINALTTSAAVALTLEDKNTFKGVWVVYDYDTKAYPICLFRKEIAAHQYREKLGYGHVRFLEFGVEWGAF